MTITANTIDYSINTNAATSSVVAREMSISIERFSKRLTHVAQGVVSEGKTASGRYTLKNSNGSVAITCEKMASRYIGLLTIPRIRIELDFNRYDTSQIDIFMQGFDRAYLELGG